jgi:hypothetical protein
LNPYRAKRIGAAARNRMLSEHTYQHRALQLQKVLNGHFTTPRPASLWIDSVQQTPVPEVNA